MSSNIYLSRLNLIQRFISDSKFRENYYRTCGLLANAYYYNVLPTIVEQDSKFKPLCNEALYTIAMVMANQSTEFNKCAANEPMLRHMFKNSESVMQIVDAISEISGYNGETYSAEQTNSCLTELSSTSMETKIKQAMDDLADFITDSDEVDEEVPEETVDYIAEDELQVDEDELQVDEEYELNGVRDDSEDDSTDAGLDDIKFSADELEASKNMAEKQGTINDLDESSTNESNEEEDVSDIGYVEDIDEVIAAILNRNEAVFRSCLELDRPYGMLYEKGLLTYKVENGTLRYIPGVGKGRSVFENLYAAIMNGTGARLLTAPDLRNVPNATNIQEMNSDYYPGYIFKYALGLVDDKRHTSWSSFQNSVKGSLYKKLKALYKKELFFENMEKIERIFSTAILVLSYEGGAGIKLRVSLPGVTINTANLESAIRNITTYKSAGITITQVNDYMDVVDVQVYLQEDKFLDRPYWAYKAMRLKIDNGEPISLSDGLPIGRRVNGDIVDFKLDPSNRFLTFLAAGSGAGKGVLTLSLVAAAIGSNVPMFYMDYKPDMAPIFWDIEKKYNINTFTYDGMVLRRPNSDNPNHVQGNGMPAEVAKVLQKYSGAILYLKAVQLMCAMAQYRADVGAQDDIMFVFDETQAMQRLIKNAVEKTVELKKAHAPKKSKGTEEEPDEVYTYASVLLDWFKEVNVNIDTYVNTTGRKSNTFCIFIAQSPDYSTWTNLKAKTDNGQIELLSRITFADTIFKILGRGSTTSKYGLGGDGKKSVTPKELKYVANNRFFGMYDGKTTDGADITIFKPFLTLNSDNPMDKCWTKGMGKKYGYGSLSDDQYKNNVAQEHPGEPGYSNSDGIHTGTGLLGLTSMYCNGDMNKVTSNFASGWGYCMEFFQQTGLSAKYSNPSDYMYDTSLDGLMMIGNMVAYNPAEENSAKLGVSIDGDNGDYSREDVDTGIEIDLGGIENEGSVEIDDNDELNIFGTDSGLGFNGNTQRVAKTLEDIEEEEALKAYQESSNDGDAFRETGNAAGTKEVIQSIINEAPDGCDLLDFISSALDEDVKSGYISKEVASSIAEQYKLAERGYAVTNDFTNVDGDNYIKREREYVRQPVFVDNNATEASSTFGNEGQFTRVDTTKTKNFTHLNDENSIDCRRAIVREPKFIQKMMLKTYRGAERYVSNIWKQILTDIKNQGYSPALITRVSFHGGHMYVNGKIIMLDGILGGRQNIRLKDIVEYQMLFKKFPMIKELRLDEEMLQLALMELGENSLSSLFTLGRKLESVYIKMIDGSTQRITRQSAMAEEARNLESKAKVSNDIDMYCKSKRKKSWSEYTPGENIGALRLAKSSFSNAGKAFLNNNKPSIGLTMLYGGVGIISGVLGTAVLAGINGYKGIRRLGDSFRG